MRVCTETAVIAVCFGSHSYVCLPDEVAEKCFRASFFFMDVLWINFGKN